MSVGREVRGEVSRLAAPTRSSVVRVREVIQETADACSFVIDPDRDAAEAFEYRAGQFLTIRVPDAGSGSARCYSLSSSPHSDAALKFTVKRVVGGHGSNWLCDSVSAGDELEVLRPAGVFTPKSLDESVVLIAGGSGITPVISIAKSILTAGSGEVVLLYANRGEDAVIFAEELRALEDRYAGRLIVVHILQSLQGYPSRQLLGWLLRPFTDREIYICGPTLLMDLASEICKEAEIPACRIHVERFASLQQDPFAPVGIENSADAAADDVVSTARVSIDGEDHIVPWKASHKLLDAMVSAGIDAPYSCREGSCGACSFKLTAGEVRMAHNEILTEEDIADGYILTCQAEPVSDEVAIQY
ncbi:ferredoxin--NADP reductase [Rhodococcus erythropolis]|nr:ferredoxin--NADP reductase [Rhodococcus erythropolis]